MFAVLCCIRFNYDQNSHTYDALDICVNGSNEIDVPEYEPGQPTNDSFAYIKSQSSRKVQARFYQDIGDIGSLKIKATVYSGTGFGNLPATWVTFNGSSNSSYTTFTSNGSVPSTVGRRVFYWKWELVDIIYDYNRILAVKPINHPPKELHKERETITSIDLPQDIENISHLYYTLLSSPQSPMSVPWTDVLDYACVWASGESSYSSAASKVTEKIYNELGDTDGDIDYDWPRGRLFYSSGSSYNWRTFDLSDFFHDIDNNSNVLVNCSDIGNLVNIFSAAIGCNSRSKIIYGGFGTNSIDPIGSPNWNTASWSYHQYGWFNNKVYDACIKIDRYGNPRIAKNMTQSTYDNYLLAPGENYSNSNTGNASVE